MDLKQWKLNPVDEFDDDEEEETLSLCDLAVNNSINVSDSDGSFQEDQSSSFDQDIFEFFSSNFTTTYPKDNIIFCGKMIPYKGENEAQKNSINSVAKSKTTKKGFMIFPWHSFNITRSTSVKMEREKSYRTCKNFPEATPEEVVEEDFMAKFSVGGRRRRSRWHLFAFGLGRYRGEMELKDIKTRQSKLSDRKMRRSLKFDDMAEIEISGNGKSEKKWWSLARILGCQSSHANAMVKASLGLMPN